METGLIDRYMDKWLNCFCLFTKYWGRIDFVGLIKDYSLGVRIQIAESYESWRDGLVPRKVILNPRIGISAGVSTPCSLL